MRMRFHSAIVYAAILLPVVAQVGWADIVSYWTFDEGSGTIAYDSASGNDGTINGAQWTSGVRGTALSFDGEDDYVDCGNEASTGFSSGDNFTVEAWIKYSGPTNFRAIAARHDDIRGTFNYALGLAEGKLVFVADQAYEGAIRLSSNINLLENLWYHVAGVYDNKSMSVYVNGVEQGSALFDEGGLTDRGANFYIGNTGHWSGYEDIRYFNGVIDELRIYDTALSDTAILQSYTNVVPVPTALLLGILGLGHAGMRLKQGSRWVTASRLRLKENYSHVSV